MVIDLGDQAVKAQGIADRNTRGEHVLQVAGGVFIESVHTKRQERAWLAVVLIDDSAVGMTRERWDERPLLPEDGSLRMQPRLLLYYTVFQSEISLSGRSPRYLVHCAS